MLQGAMWLRFQHPAPVTAGELQHVGWREEEKLAREGIAAATAPPPAVAPTVAVVAAAAAAGAGPKVYTMQEVEEHSSEDSAWFVHESKVSCKRLWPPGAAAADRGFAA